jgi:hypothetical protein
MFDALSAAIKSLIKAPGSPVKDIEVTFDRPSDDYASKLTVATVNVFLFDVREEKTLRSNEWSFERSNGSVKVGRAPFFATCS